MPGYTPFIHRRISMMALMAVFLWAGLPVSWSASGEETQTRMNQEVLAGKPIVVHGIVALCDNANQGIVRVPKRLGNGQDPRSNLFWGATYGLRTYLVRQGGWTSLQVEQPGEKKIRERIVLFNSFQRAGTSASVYLVADAWDGAEIKPAIEKFLAMASGDAVETISVRRDSRVVSFSAGGAAHLVVFMGHNGLMGFSVNGPDKRREKASTSAMKAWSAVARSKICIGIPNLR